VLEKSEGRAQYWSEIQSLYIHALHILHNKNVVQGMSEEEWGLQLLFYNMFQYFDDVSVSGGLV